MSVCSQTRCETEHTHRESAAWLMENSWLINENVIEEIENLLKPRNALCMCECVHHGPHNVSYDVCECLAFCVLRRARYALAVVVHGCMMPFIQQLLMWSTGDMAVVFVIIILRALRNRKMFNRLCSIRANSGGTLLRSLCVSCAKGEYVQCFTSCLCCDAVVDVVVLKSIFVRFWCVFCSPASLLAEWANVRSARKGPFFAMFINYRK